MSKLGKNLKKSGKHATEEKLMLLYYKAVEYFEKNKNLVYTILTVLVVIIAVLFIYFRNQNQKSETAAIELGKVKQVYSMDMFQQAISGDSLGMSKGLIYIVDNYGSTESGQTAKIMLGNCYFNLRDFDNAEKSFNSFSGSNDMLKAASLSGLGAVQEAKNNFTEAAKFYDKASKVNKKLANNDEYIFYAIRSYFNAKDNDNLSKAIKLLKTDYPKSKYIALIARYDNTQS